MPKRWISSLARALGGLLAAALVALVVVSLVPRLFGYTPYAVLSGSMEPEYPVGSLIFVHSVDAETLQPGDAATFHRSDGAVVTHQVYEVDVDTKLIGTQGIANVNADGTIAHDAEKTPFSQVIGSPVFWIPYLGYVNAYCTTPPGLYVVVAVAVLLLVASALLGKGGEGNARKSAR